MIKIDISQIISRLLSKEKRRTAFNDSGDEQLTIKVNEAALDTFSKVTTESISTPRDSSLNEQRSMPSSPIVISTVSSNHESFTTTPTPSEDKSTPSTTEILNSSFSTLSFQRREKHAPLPEEISTKITNLKKDIKNLETEQKRTLKTAEKSKTNTENDSINLIKNLYKKVIQGQIKTKKLKIHSILENFYHPNAK